MIDHRGVDCLWNPKILYSITVQAWFKLLLYMPEGKYVKNGKTRCFVRENHGSRPGTDVKKSTNLTTKSMFF